MRYRTRSTQANPRRGMVMLVVMSMLALFASTAIAFVFYADAEAVSALAARESLVKSQADIDPELLMAYFLNQLIYPTDNIYSSLRGWDLARSIYGYNPNTLNFTPYNGVGRSALSYPDLALGGVDNFTEINYQTFSAAGLPDRKPEYYGRVGDPNFRYVGGANPPWTAYDTNSLFLAEATADGTVLMPSFTRPWQAAAMNGAPAPARKYMSLRPDSSLTSGVNAWSPQFVTPDSEVDPATGIIYDVRNRDFGPGRPGGGNNDSFWIDLGFPVMTAPNGKRFKPLFAPHVVDLANRLHLWAHGNQLGTGNTHVSNQGWGASEVNLSRLPSMVPVELQWLFSKKYGAGNNPVGTPNNWLSPPFYGFRQNETYYTWYGPIDSNGAAGPAGGPYTSTNPYVMPAAGSLFPFPTFPPPAGWDNFNLAERTNNPLAFSLLNPLSPNIAPLPMSNMEALLRFGGTNAPALTSTIFANMPNTFGNTPAGQRARNMVTLNNWYFDRLAAAPYIPFDPTTPMHYQLPAPGQLPPFLAPQQVPGVVPSPPTYTPYPANSDYTGDWRSNLGTMLRVNLSRPLTDYPAPAASGIIDLTVGSASANQYAQAYQDRINFANDILNALVKVTGAQPVQFLIAGTPDYYATRYLAQLAVNIVDFIDSDDISTAFNWNPAAPGTDGWVFGTELPRVVLNEVYASYDNNNVPGDIDPVMMTSKTAKLNLYAELHNPFKPTAAGYVYPNDGGGALLTVAAGTPLAYPSYKIVAYQSSPLLTANLRDPTNPTYNLGHPDKTNVAIAALRLNASGSDVGNIATGGWGPNPQVQPANGRAGGVGAPPGGGGDFTKATIAPAATGATIAGNTVTITTTAAHGFVVGQTVAITGVANAAYNGSFTIMTVPSGTTFTYFITTPPGAASGGGSASAGGNSTTGNNGYFVIGPAGANFWPARDTYLPSNYSSTAMSVARLATDPVIPGVTLLLQRLAIPHLQHQGNPALPLYNPYITVDYVDGVKVNDNRAFGATATITMGLTPAFGASYGRTQPYAANATQFAAQTGPNSVGGAPANSLFGVNSNAASPFNWLVHLDRPLVNSQELRNVSGFKPHELTQQFITAAGNYQHRAPWTKQANLLYRALDVLGTPNPMPGTYRGGRLPGNINLNTMTEPEILLALADPQDWQASPLFTTPNVAAIFNKLIMSRNNSPTLNLLPTGEGNPFQPLSAGDVTKTWMRPDPTTGTGQLFSVGAVGTNPYAKQALLQKIFNNISTTSNVFAVWFTVGYFEVVDETVRPQRLGAEIGRSENRQIRHRFFAIVDRSGLQLFNANSTAAVTAGLGQTMSVAPASVATNTTNASTGGIGPWVASKNYVTSNAAIDPITGFAYFCLLPNIGLQPSANPTYWSLLPQVGMLLEIVDPVNGTEVVAVKTAAGNSFTADFTLPHGVGVPIVCRGNPGPQTNYNPRKDSNVVLHMSVIQ